MSGRQRLEPRKQPRQVRAELTRQRILAAAAQVFAEHGYAGGTTNRIAEQARVSIGSLYQYYPNKDAILVALISGHLDAGEADVRRFLADGLPATLPEAIRLFVRAAVRNHLDDPHLLRVMFEQSPSSPELLAKVTEHERRYLASAREMMERYPGVRVGDRDMAALIIVSTIELVVHKVIATYESVDLVVFEDELVAMLTRYLIPV